ncbi:3-deoxy-manno-octulosonate cytidylyltransferase [Sulfitobacter geojensis]|uniref:3-deoxy-manno-octulosonate cytidylyltransferase n=1 Tax=Sulfitobacter geojensis TaxID=1342299 RepID=A0AAE2VXQ1_9RHOB|nr:manno-octulosonate cytidylyltransferase [Sulfitobacter geojensis]MBM1689333.1 3-deoxy-manno-octulosonate cytidylyltransferase [Sulfitobacter geojensis]MBM1693399.1 3-deoxy-manno-octulosonate cytidylyltransferase [Sulfitobacter geojensis]MBM1705565.1 3-deoxy-manno-octulosonate cytidylyltransferase [Sulfitobacter geojensis]MBM1709623.1 3-deoxy-manno-octulosonate cytidylyltransferase [Sulfitobacter geojensis]MBM1713689.1 3-deoxy-manno-octulosonate cytidylyltransferase [Sulfitobacter geojensis]
MSVLIAIPARFASTRYPGKPLAELKGATGQSLSLIERSWRAACAVNEVDRVVVATDDNRIKDAAEAFGAEVVMTSTECANGTERCAEAHAALGGGFDIVVNLQGDAPLTPHWFVESLVQGLISAPDAEIATPVLRCDGATLNALLADRKADRVGGTTAVFATDHSAMYFSKEVVPFTSKRYSETDMTPVFHHVGVYAYRPDALAAYPSWPTGPLEQLEGLEQLRFMENGRSVLCVEVEANGREFWELNNPEDVPKIESMMEKMGLE